MTKPKHAKSEDEPTTNDEPIKIIVNKSFNRMVMNELKDVFVMFYTPQDIADSSAMRFWEELALQSLNSNDLLIAKFNAEENDSRELKSKKISKLPAMIFYPKHDKSGIVYDGSYNL